MKLKKVFGLVISVLIFAGCKTESSGSTDNADFKEVLKQPEITLGYVEEPGEPYWEYCNGLLEEGYACNATVNTHFGSGTKATVSINENNVDLYYTLDGTEPTLESNLYNVSIEIKRACILKVIAYDVPGRKKSKITSLDITGPYGRTKCENGRSIVFGDGVCALYVFYESLSDNSGIDFTKQHYAVKLDDGNLSSGDGVPRNGILAIDGLSTNWNTDATLRQNELYNLVFNADLYLASWSTLHIDGSHFSAYTKN